MAHGMPLRRSFHIMLKPAGAACNLDCAYCFYLDKAALYPGSDFRMRESVLETFTRQYLESQPGPEGTFAWQGGEPTLMGLDFYRTALRFQQDYARPGQRVTNTFQTNGILLDDAWCEFFHQHHVLVGLSLDGPQALHDAYRGDKAGRGTFARVMQAVARLRKHQVEFNILACVHAANAGQPLAVYRFLRDRVGARFIQFIPIVGCAPDRTQATASSVSATQYGEFLIAIFDEWVRQDVGQVFVQVFDVALAAWLGYRPGLCIFEETCGAALVMEHTGDVYACDHFVDAAHRLGNLQDTPLLALVNAPQQQQFGLSKRDSLPRTCRECPVRFVCHGGCPKNRFLITPDGEPGLNYLCAGYRAFFTHIDRPMRIMAAELRANRAPANVMRILAQEER
jgi:uncharacterized protein